MADPAVLDRLRRVGGFVLDMDGTLVMGDRNNQGMVALPGAAQLLRTLVEQGTGFCIYTNGTVKTPEQIAEVLQGIGLPVGADQALTPASTAVDVFLERGHRRRVGARGHGCPRPVGEARRAALPPVPGHPRVRAVECAF